MNRCRALLGPIALCVLMAGIATAGVLPQTIVTGDASSADATKQIQSFIDQQVKALSDATQPSAQQAARDALIGEVVGAMQPSSSFLDVYSNALDKALLPLTQSDAMRVRLNTAIVTARIAARVENARLRDIAHALVKDQSDAVALWGIKAAHWILPSVLRNPLIAQSDPLLNEIVPAAKKHAGGAITQAAYDALSLGVIDSREALVAPDMLRQTLPQLLDLLKFRVQQYQHRTPSEPAAENRASLFLADRRVWSVASDAQHVEMVQLLSQLLSVAGQRATQDASHREQLVPVIQQTASALWVMADYLKAPVLQAATTPLIKLGVNAPGPQIMKDVAAVEQAIRGIKGFESVKPAPVVGKEEEPATQHSATATAPAN